MACLHVLFHIAICNSEPLLIQLQKLVVLKQRILTVEDSNTVSMAGL